MQPTICLTCPHCAFSREVPGEKVPDRPVRVTCPKCKQVFEFQKPSPLPAAAAPPAGIAPAPQTDNRSTTPPLPPPSPPGPPVVEIPPSPLPPPPAADSFSSDPAPPRQSARSTGQAPAEPAPQQPPEKIKRTPPPPVRRLPDVGELFGEVWDSYRRRWLLLTGLFFVAAAGAALPLVIVGAGMAWLGKNSVTIDSSVLALLTALAVVAGLIGFFRGLAAVIAAAGDESIGFREALARGSTCWGTLFWVSSLYGFIVGGASLLLIIPGILAGVWLFAAPYIAVAGDARGMEALLKSRAIVRNRFWPVFLRLFLVWLLATVLGMIPLAGPFLALLMAPFTMLYQVILSRSLAESADNVTGPYTSSDKARWLLLGLAGYLLIPVVIISIFGTAFIGSLLPLLKSGSLPAQGRQVITIPPPCGELPAGFSPGSGPGTVAAPPASMSPSPTSETGSAPGPAAAGSQLRATDLSVFIYAVNAPGAIRVNGQEFKVIKAEPDMQYNINAFGEQFRPGENSISFDVTPSPGEGRQLSPAIHMKVSRGGKVLGEWRLPDKDGWPRSVTVTVPAEQTP